jgi:hypothetical protein
VRTDNGMATYLTAGDLSLDDTRQKIEATR